MRHRKSYCSDGTCGALDCYRCHGDDYLCENCGVVADCECEKCKHCEGYIEVDEHLRKGSEVQEDYSLPDRFAHTGEKKQCDCLRCGECDESCEYDCKCTRCEGCGEREPLCDCEDRFGMTNAEEAGVHPGTNEDAGGGSETLEKNEE